MRPEETFHCSAALLRSNVSRASSGAAPDMEEQLQILLSPQSTSDTVNKKLEVFHEKRVQHTQSQAE